jgi:hypothetical protein
VLALSQGQSRDLPAASGISRKKIMLAAENMEDALRIAEEEPDA